MISLFDGIYRDQRVASANQLQIMLKLSQQDLMSGLVEVSYSPEEKILLLLNSGNITCVYHCTGDVIARTPISDLPVLLSAFPGGNIRVCSLAPSFLRAVKTIVEQPRASKVLALHTTELPKSIHEYQALPEASLLQFRWHSAEGFVFLPGHNFPARQYAFLTEGQSSDSAAAVSMFSRWSEAECTVSYYLGDPAVQIWQENTLQLGFALLIEHTLRRYEELVGHLLSGKLEDSINRLCRTQSWNISVADSTMDDVQLFDTLEDTIAAYRAIFDLASRQIAGVIGTRLFNEALENSLESLGGSLRQAVEKIDLAAALPANR